MEISVTTDIGIDNLTGFFTEAQFTVNSFNCWGHEVKYICPWRIISDIEIIYIPEGEYHIKTNGGDLILKSGDMVIIPPFMPHEIRAVGKGTIECWVHFDSLSPYFRDRLVEAFLDAWGGYTKHIGLNDDILSIFEEMKRERENKKNGYGARLNFIFNIMLLDIIRKYDINIDSKIAATNSKNMFTKIVEKVYHNFKDYTNIQDLADECNISVSYLTKLFHQNLKIPPNKFIMMLRMREAEKLIRTTNMTVQEIAMSLNFSSGYHFTNTFKKYYKIAPTQYKKIMLGYNF